MDSATLFLGLLFGSFGVGYFIYGKRQSNWAALAVGIGLCVFPYFVTNIWLMVAVGIILMALPFFFRD